MGWLTIDLRSDLDAPDHHGDPAEVIDALDALLGARPAWHADAACREHPELSWYPERGDVIVEQRRICHGCLARRECLTDAIERDDRHGIWAGTSPRTRRDARRAHPGDTQAQLDALLGASVAV